MELHDQSDLQLQLATHIADEYSIPDIVDLADHAHRKGCTRFWVNDNLGYRNIFTVLAAVATEVPIGLGTSIVVPYYRNPVDLADTVASLTELQPGRELKLGLGRGSLAQTGVEIETPAPYEVLSETTRCVESLLAGETIRFGDYPRLTELFGLQPEAEMHLRFPPRGPVRTYLGGYGPTALQTAGETMGGVLFGGWFQPLLKAGRVDELTERARSAARDAETEKELDIIAEVNLSLAEDPEEAMRFGRTHVSHAIISLSRQLSDEEFEDLGIDPRNVDRLKAAFEGNATVQEARELVTEPMVDAFFVVGTPEQCVEQLRELGEYSPDVDTVLYAKLGPDFEEAIELLSDDVLPRV